jgi:uncharacterized membrane protein
VSFDRQLSARERSSSWGRRFRLREAFAHSLVIIPCAYIVGAIVLGELVPRIEGNRDLLSLRLDADTARTILSSVASGMIAFTGLVVSIAVVVVQFAATQYTPRLVARFRGDPLVKHALGVFVAPTIYALVALRNIGRHASTTVPSLTVVLGLVLLIVALIVFFVLVGRLLDLLRPRRVIARVVERASQAIAETYPFPVGSRPRSQPPAVTPVTSTIRHPGRPRVLSALDRGRIVRIASAADVIIEVALGVGAAVSTDAPLFYVHGSAERVDADELRQSAVLAEERTITQDPAFAIRALVDIALRALSPAVNDPTTAVHVLDGVEELLMELAARDLERGAVADGDGALRLVYPNPSWNELLDLALTEVRFYGADSPQIARRLRAMLFDLADTVPDICRDAVAAQLARLDVAVGAAYPDPVERAHAEQADRLGIGGAAPAGALDASRRK